MVTSLSASIQLSCDCALHHPDPHVCQASEAQAQQSRCLAGLAGLLGSHGVPPVPVLGEKAHGPHHPQAGELELVCVCVCVCVGVWVWVFLFSVLLPFFGGTHDQLECVTECMHG